MTTMIVSGDFKYLDNDKLRGFVEKFLHKEKATMEFGILDSMIFKEIPSGLERCIKRQFCFSQFPNSNSIKLCKSQLLSHFYILS